MKQVKSMVVMAAAFAALVGRAGESAEFRLDTMDGTRTARSVETIAYSTAWNGGGTVTVAVDGAAIKEANAPATGDVVWNAAQATPGTHTLTHTCGGETLTAVFEVQMSPPPTLAVESADWSSGSITLRCEDSDTSGTAHEYTLEYKNTSGVWEEVDGAKNKLATKGQDANGQEVLIAKLTDNTFWSRLGGLPPVEYRVKDENGRLSEGCMTRTRYGLAVGLGKYDSKLRDKYGFSEMDICRNNATLAGEIMTQHGGGIEGGNMTVLTDGDAKVKDIGEEWRRLAQDKTKTGDVVFFFIATHGGSWGALAAYDKLYTVSQFQKDIEPFRTGNRSGVKLVVLLLNCHSEAMTSEVKSINFEYGSICTANIIYVAVAGAKESEYNLHRDDEEDAGWFRRRTYSEGGEFFLNQGLKKRQADVLRTLQGIEGEFGNKDGVVDLLECVKYMDALTIGVSDRSQTHAQYDKNKCEAMKKTVVVVGEQSSGMSAPPAPHMISVTVESGIVNILLDDVGSAQYYKFYYYDVVAKETHWVSNSRGGTITMEKAMFKTADMATYEDRKYFVPLENDTEYNFYAIAVNAGGQSPKSNVITMRTMPATRNPRYRVSLMAEGGKVSPTHIDVESGLPVGQLPVPTREGRTFLGWFTESQGGTEVAPETTITADIKYYARWSNPATEIYLPGEWLQCYPAVTLASGGDAGIATDMLSANGNRTVGECYALGVDPEDPDDDLKIAEFKMKDGKPEITLNHTKDGSGNSFEDRVKVLGKAELSDAEWQEVPPEGNPAYRFFKVGVEMP